MCKFYFASSQKRKSEAKFVKNKKVFEWLARLSDTFNYSCFIEPSWPGSGQSDFIFFSKTTTFNIEVRNWHGVIKGGTRDNWFVDRKNIKENPLLHSKYMAESFKIYLSEIYPTLLPETIKVYPIVVLPMTRPEMYIPRYGPHGWTNVITDEQQLIDAIEKSSSERGVTVGDLIEDSASLFNVKRLSLDKLRAIVDKYMSKEQR
jgi:hypothetical protein